LGKRKVSNIPNQSQHDYFIYSRNSPPPPKDTSVIRTLFTNTAVAKIKGSFKLSATIIN
jgi:hypothetical protein